jgi:hypothetical protein
LRVFGLIARATPRLDSIYGRKRAGASVGDARIGVGKLGHIRCACLAKPPQQHFERVDLCDEPATKSVLS